MTNRTIPPIPTRMPDSRLPWLDRVRWRWRFWRAGWRPAPRDIQRDLAERAALQRDWLAHQTEQREIEMIRQVTREQAAYNERIRQKQAQNARIRVRVIAEQAPANSGLTIA